MNWRVSGLDGRTLVSNSDAHSPAKLAREANLLSVEASYAALRRAVETGEGFEGTIEFFPEEGKYHLDGHRACDVCLEPSETMRLEGRCPACGRKLTIGVKHRAEQLADRPEGCPPPASGRPFESLMPLPEVLASCMGVSSASKKVTERYFALLSALGNELYILRECSPRRHTRRRRMGAGGGRPPPARGQRAAQERLRRRIRRHFPLRARGTGSARRADGDVRHVRRARQRQSRPPPGRAGLKQGRGRKPRRWRAASTTSSDARWSPRRARWRSSPGRARARRSRSWSASCICWDRARSLRTSRR